MVSVMHFLHAYFVIKRPDATTILYDARHKVADCREEAARHACGESKWRSIGAESSCKSRA